MANLAGDSETFWIRAILFKYTVFAVVFVGDLIPGTDVGVGVGEFSRDVFNILGYVFVVSFCGDIERVVLFGHIYLTVCWFGRNWQRNNRREREFMQVFTVDYAYFSI